MLDVKKELHLFFTALVFYTRIPISNWVPYKEESQALSARYFPLVGTVVGTLTALVFWTAALLFATPIAILLAMTTAIWVTGALHEDGFADLCDGFGGGWTKERILEIMKDSSLGTFGVLGLIVAMGIKFLALAQLPIDVVPLTFIAGHTISRYVAITFLNTHAYARSDDTQKAGAMVRPMRPAEQLIALLPALIAALSMFLIFSPLLVVISIIPLAIIRWYLGKLFMRKLEGYTGDCLGATQQITEVIFYLMLSL